MLNSIRKLYQKFVVENPDINISHILAFCDANHFGLPVLEILTERHAFASNMTTFNILLTLCTNKKDCKNSQLAGNYRVVHV